MHSHYGSLQIVWDFSSLESLFFFFHLQIYLSSYNFREVRETPAETLMDSADGTVLDTAETAAGNLLGVLKTPKTPEGVNEKSAGDCC